MTDFLVVKDKVQRYARELYSDVRIDADGDIVIPLEENNVYITVWEREFSDPEAEKFFNENQLARVLVKVWSHVLVQLSPSLELFKWVATNGQDVTYGHFLLFPLDESESSFNLIFADQIPGDTLDPGELKDALLAVEWSVNSAIEELKPIFGGKTPREAAQ